MRHVLHAAWTIWLLVLLLVPSAHAAESQAPFRLFRLGGPDLPTTQVVTGLHDAGAIEMPSAAIKPYPNAAGWWRLDILRDVPRVPRRVLVLKVLNGTVTHAWFPHRSDPVTRANGGDYADPSYSAGVEVFPLQDGLFAGDRIYLQVTAESDVPIQLSIQDEQAFQAIDRSHMQYDMFIYGTLLALVLVGIGFGLSLRDTDFLLLASAMGLILLFLLDNRSELYRIPVLAWIPGSQQAQWILSTLSAAFCTLFMLRYLQMRRRSPWLARVQYAALATFALVILASLTPGINQWSRWGMVGNLAILTCAACGISAAAKATIHGYHPARMFLWSWLPMACLLAWRIFEITFRWVPNPLLDAAFPASFVLLGVMLMTGLAERMLTYRHERDTSDMLARRDPLTGLFNRRALDEMLRQAALESGHEAKPLALLFIDLDHFKRINDSHGHDVGDEVLRESARRIRAALRHGDIVGRYGGEEFVVGLPHTSATDAAAKGDRIRAAVGAQPICCGELEIAVTISIGVAVLDNGLPGFDAAIKRADGALYASKRDGRDRVSVAMA